jgi:hypothetical protein
MTRGNKVMAGFAVLLLAGSAMVSAQSGSSAGAKPGGSPRGIYLSGAALGVSAEIEIDRDGQRGMVPPTYEFRSGDKFWLHVTTNRDAYIYVLNRTLVGDPQGAASRGIKLMQQDDIRHPAPDAYTMVYPAPKSAPALVKANATTRIPRGSNEFFVMDNMIGAEKVMIVVTDKPSNITQFFDPTTGKLKHSASTADSSASVLNRLNTELATMADNTEIEEPPRSRGIVIKPIPGPSNRVPELPVPSTPPRPGENRPDVIVGDGTKSSPEGKTHGVEKNPARGIMQELTLVHVAH